MNNRAIADILEATASLYELHSENEFKTRALRSAALTISKHVDPLSGMSLEALSGIHGIGKGISAKVHEICTKGTLEDYEMLVSKTPPGVMELFQIKGLGPKKISVLWKELNIESPGQLLYACNENRLVTLKGFSEKTQSEIKRKLEFRASQQGLFHFALAENCLSRFLNLWSATIPQFSIEVIGEMRRKNEVVKNIQLITNAIVDDVSFDHELLLTHRFAIQELNESILLISCEEGPFISISLNMEVSGYTVFHHTGPADHVQEILNRIPNFEVGVTSFANEYEIYQLAGVDFVPPEMRDLDIDLINALSVTETDLIQFDDLRGCLHNHSTYSDGASTLREMALAVQKMGLQYFAICDHSKSAFYAGGLKEEEIIRQHQEVDLLNAELAPFRIFKGIESDILSDGSLDYSNEILATFDLVVASIHSGLQMDMDKATSRLIKAIENPFTTILGHPTGRLLLSREGYPIDHLKVLDACAANGVAIELNAHPYRLDIDWRWLHHAINRGVMISINPDAHHVSGIYDMQYGVNVARKAGVKNIHVLNSFDLESFNNWLLAKQPLKFINQ